MTDKIEVKVISLGRRFLNGKMHEAVLPVDLYHKYNNSDEPNLLWQLDNQASWFATKSRQFPAVGWVFSIMAEVNEKGRVTTYNVNSVKVDTTSEVSDHCKEWQARDRMAVVESNNAKQLKKLSTDTRLQADIDKLKRVCKSLPGSQRVAFATMVMSELLK